MKRIFECQNTKYNIPQKPPVFNNEDKLYWREKIKYLLKKRNAVMVSHYYTDADIQKLTEETGGCVADSLEMARFGSNHPADVLLVSGVRFMGETAKILSPHKQILMPTLQAECSLDLGCQIEEFNNFCNMHPDRTVVVYANTSISIKARADWIVTSSIAVNIISHLHSLGQKIIWAPDRHLGRYITQKTKADMLCWQGECIVHNEFKAHELQKMKIIHPKAAILVHPEAPQNIINLADFVGSTSQLIKEAKLLSNPQIIVATDRGIFYKMQKAVPDKELLIAPTAGEGATCQSCAYCPWMAMNNLKNISESLEYGGKLYEIHINKELSKAALIPLKKMLSFQNELLFN